jgi:hypothetical protein
MDIRTLSEVRTRDPNAWTLKGAFGKCYIIGGGGTGRTWRLSVWDLGNNFHHWQM